MGQGPGNAQRNQKQINGGWDTNAGHFDDSISESLEWNSKGFELLKNVSAKFI